MKLLIVDDSNIMRRAIEKYLSGKKLQVVGTAGDGESALQLFLRYEPDLVTLDITMPKMDGLTCLEEMLRIRPGVKVLIVSALKDPSTGLQALRKGACGFLPKPFTERQLVEEISAVCGDSI